MSLKHSSPWDAKTFTKKLREVGSCAYHDKHPFHLLMNSGKLSPQSIRAWVTNRFYYQANIPIKDAAIMSNCPIREIRRLWIHRIEDHDGHKGDEGGLGAWLRLGEACGLSRKEMLDHSGVLSGVRFAVDAYVNFTRTQPWPVAISSSLTELFAPDLMARRIEAFQEYYRWIRPEGLEYFKSRVTQARRDSQEGLQITLEYCATREMQESAVKALKFKCDLLWAMLDAIHNHCKTNEPG